MRRYGAGAARDWCIWEDAVIAHEALGKPGTCSDKPDDALMVSVRFRANYFVNDADSNSDNSRAKRVGWPGIPAVLIHGRLDLGSPLKTA
ncbi:hypothetical protein ACFCX4_06445 [Kitasatospora sp. NPDC056327]|uniref:hypothetical protein n=1 Tax=Kitasatospora sp. NPDC056327 TaxID=3345785 RepID=UPI0035E0DD29